MKVFQLLLSLVAAATAAVLVLSPTSTGFSKRGFSLGVNQRDFRIFNNFTSPAANSNQVADPNFPGYFGAEQAIWKGCIEWNSRLHGDGGGDPTQPFDLGSGDSNFDCSFQGRALGPGSTMSNTHSQISGCGGGILFFTEGGGGGFRIRYYECVDWRDDPGPTTDGFDLQSAACTAYGFALGLGNSSVPGATMGSSFMPGFTHRRSLEPDDIAGLQCIYGVASVGIKPIISSLALAGSSLTITGQNFDPVANTVWFTPAAATADGVPVKVLALPSTAGGTQIVLNVPAAAGPGDVLVKNQAGGGASLSNAMPLDANPCPPAVNYCIGATHSQGGNAFLDSLGSQSIGANNFTLTVNEAPSNKFGLFYFGPNQIQSSFGDGFRCVGGMTQRLFPILQTDGVGFGSHALNFSNHPAITPGSLQRFQFWFRDPMGPGGSGFNTSDGLSVAFCD